MNAKKVVTPLLLLFVGASVVYLLISESKPVESNLSAQTPASTKQPAPTDVPAPVNPSEKAVAEKTAAAQTVAAYYFHSTQRCRTCLTIERLAREALTEQFANALTNGALEWRAVNTDEPANAHFIKDYELVASALVLVQRRDGDQVSWVNLDRVWDLVHDEPAFKRYVIEQTRAYLEP